MQYISGVLHPATRATDKHLLSEKDTGDMLHRSDADRLATA
jgi:hypothetical protein